MQFNRVYAIRFYIACLVIFSGCSDKIADAPELQRHFQGIEETVLSHKLLVRRLTFEGNSLPAGWEIGIFTWDGIIGGAGVWDADTGMTIEVYGSEGGAVQFFAGDYFAAKLWDASTSREYTSDITFTRGNNTWIANALSEVRINGANEREIVVSLSAGWNLISINVIPPRTMFTRPDGPDMRKMFSQITSINPSNLLIVKNERGNFYMPTRNFNNITWWSIAEGYQVKVIEAVECRWTGRPVVPQTEISLETGWNIVGYYPDYPLSCDSITFNAISSIKNSVTLVKDITGRFADPSIGYSNMLPWRQGEAYQIRVRYSVLLEYPEPEAIVPERPPEDTSTMIGPWRVPGRTSANMSLLLTEIAGVANSDGDAVAVFDAAGNLVGAGYVVRGEAGLAVWSDDPITEEVDGLTDGEAFEVKYWSEATGEIYELRLHNVIKGSGFVFELDGYTVAETAIFNP